MLRPVRRTAAAIFCPPGPQTALFPFVDFSL